MLLAKRMGKTRVIAETGAGQHGVATATIAALMGMECEVYMGAEDCERQALNVYRMELLGAKVHPVTSGTSTLKDAVSEAMREWTNPHVRYALCIGLCYGRSSIPYDRSCEAAHSLYLSQLGHQDSSPGFLSVWFRPRWVFMGYIIP